MSGMSGVTQRKRGEWSADQVLKELKTYSKKDYREGMSRFGIKGEKRLGVPIPDIRRLARRIGDDHELALQLWDSGVHEARILTAMIADPNELTEEELEKLVSEIDSWDICDNLCGELILDSPFSEDKIFEWSERDEEFVKRSAFVLIANFAVHRKDMDDEEFVRYFDLIRKGSTDDRNIVKKGVDWALRQIGKRSIKLNGLAAEVAESLKETESKSARWIGSNSLLELQSTKVLKRLEAKEFRNKGHIPASNKRKKL